MAPHPDVLHLRGPERVRPDRLEAGGAVAHPPHPGDPSGEAVAPSGQQPPSSVPARVERTASDVATADRHVRPSTPTTADTLRGQAPPRIAAREAGQQPSRVRGVVGEVGVHLHDHVRAQGVQSVDHAPHVGPSESAPGAFQEADAIIGRGELPDQAGGAVRAFVVDDQEGGVRVPVQPDQPPQQRYDVGCLVVRRDDEARTGPGCFLAQHDAPSASVGGSGNPAGFYSKRIAGNERNCHGAVVRGPRARNGLPPGQDREASRPPVRNSGFVSYRSGAPMVDELDQAEAVWGEFRVRLMRFRSSESTRPAIPRLPVPSRAAG